MRHGPSIVYAHGQLIVAWSPGYAPAASSCSRASTSAIT